VENHVTESNCEDGRLMGLLQDFCTGGDETSGPAATEAVRMLVLFIV
jgi:hypothetical protein